MIALILLGLNLLAAFFKPKTRLEAENAALRQELIVLQRKVHGRVQLTSGERLFFVQLYRWFPSILTVITIVRPETLVRWHRAGFRRYWRWRSCAVGGRPPISVELRALVRRMSREDPLWGAPRIHGELLKLGFLRSLSQLSPNICLGRGATAPPVRAGRPFCATMRRRLPPWICLWCRRLPLICSTPSSLFGWLGESLSGSM
jgi:hypothetical protein